VAYALLAISAGCLGWFVRNALVTVLGGISRHQQEARLQTLAAQSRKPLPFHGFLLLVEDAVGKLRKLDWLEMYFSHIARQLQRMGRNDLKAVQVLGYQILGAVGGALVFGLLAGSLFLAFFALLIGGMLPIIWLRDNALKREKKLLRELPNALEILSLCSEAGLSLEQALDQYLKNAKPGPLREELSEILKQTRTGSSRKNALEAVSSRLDLTDFSLFSTSLIQAEKFGTGVAKVLRQLSLTMRDKQTQRAEKAVQEMPVKMLVPLILFIMPVTFLIIFGPIVLQFLK
jgi:Flp pilus assembly protein TadB